MCVTSSTERYLSVLTMSAPDARNSSVLTSPVTPMMGPRNPIFLISLAASGPFITGMLSCVVFCWRGLEGSRRQMERDEKG